MLDVQATATMLRQMGAVSAVMATDDGFVAVSRDGDVSATFALEAEAQVASDWLGGLIVRRDAHSSATGCTCDEHVGAR